MTVSSDFPTRYWQTIAIAISSSLQSGESKPEIIVRKRFGLQWSNLLTVAAIFAVIAIMSARGVPGVNETHYLTKAKHFWNPGWCGKDLFLASSDAHYAFFLIFGWPTTFLSLDSFALVGRIVCWIAMSLAWLRLNATFGIRNWLMPFNAAMMLLLSNHFDMAGEWVVGGFEAKSVTYVFVLLTIVSFLRKEWSSFWVYLGIGCLFHLVIGVWAFLCFATVSLLSPSGTEIYHRFKWSKIPTTFSIFVLLVIAAVIPAIAADTTTPQETIIKANEIQVHSRLAHHLLFGSFPTIQIARFILIVIFWNISSTYVLALVDDRAKFFSFRKFCNASLIISVCGVMLSAVAEEKVSGSDVSNALLKFYWFRFADFAIPLGLSMVCGIACSRIMDSTVTSRKWSCLVALVAISLASVFSIVERFDDHRPPAAQVSLPMYPDDRARTYECFVNFVKACRWASSNTARDSVFVTPYNQQIFKWYSDRAELACWKDAPQDAMGIVEWKSRIDWLSSFDHLPGGILQLNSDQAQALRERSDATYVLAPQALEDIAINQDLLSSSLKRVYPLDSGARSTYVIYEIVN